MDQHRRFLPSTSLIFFQKITHEHRVSRFCSTGHPILPYFARQSSCESCNETCTLCLPCPACGDFEFNVSDTTNLPGSHESITVLAIKPDLIDIATESEMKAYLRSVGVKVPKDITL